MSGKFYLEKWIDTDLQPYFDENRRWSVCDLRAIYVRAFCKGQEQSANRDEEIARRAFEAARLSAYSGTVDLTPPLDWDEPTDDFKYETFEEYFNSEEFKKATK